MSSLLAKRILVIVTGGIAAYKAPEVVRRLADAGAETRVVMTASAREFITALTLQAVSGQEVRGELFDADAEAGMGHIELARWADAVLIAPASANFIARLRHGQSDDLASAICLATHAPILIAPAMNQQMWQHPATVENLAVLAERGINFCGPDSGSQACGEVGPGRMLETPEIIQAASGLFDHLALAGRRVMITAGPTREAIDPVRYISNHSSGKMGYAIAAAATEAGAAVELIAGPTALAQPRVAQFTAIESALEMHAAVMKSLAEVDIFIATAAVADYRVEQVPEHKIKRDGRPLTLQLIPNPDILAAVAAAQSPPFTVGFAAETENLVEHAKQKLARKRIDMIAANQVGVNLGFNTDDNELTVIWTDGQHQLARASKDQLARQLIELVAQRFAISRAD